MAPLCPFNHLLNLFFQRPKSTNSFKTTAKPLINHIVLMEGKVLIHTGLNKNAKKIRTLQKFFFVLDTKISKKKKKHIRQTKTTLLKRA